MSSDISKRRIGVVTGSRAEYGLLYWLMKEIEQDPSLELLTVVTGMHLSSEFGLTYKVIEADGFPIAAKVEMLLAGDTPASITRSIGLGFIGFADALERLRPDLIVVLGDRFEILPAVTAALVQRVPVAHLHGGEVTVGAVDEALRHAFTKMSHLHFTAADEYRRRVIQMGEDPDRVYNVGALGIDGIKRATLLERRELERRVGMDFGSLNLLVTFHPVTLETDTAASQIASLLDVLDTLDEARIIFTAPNADTDGRVILDHIKRFVDAHPDRCRLFTSMGQLLYLSAMKHVDVVVGNSSSGIIEAPSFGVVTVNIGDRQRGRLRADSVIDCDPDKGSIAEAMARAVQPETRARARKTVNPYGDGGASARIKEILKNADLRNIVKKEFHDLSGPLPAIARP